MLVERNNSDAFVINPLPDGSRVILDSENERILALNATAGAAWDACTVPTSLSGVTERMQSSLHPEITEELAEDAILQLQQKGLVKTSGSSSQSTRREFIATLSTVAVPLVVSLSVAEQRAYAATARSGGSGNQGNQGNNGNPGDEEHRGNSSGNQGNGPNSGDQGNQGNEH
jgi:hypothetical protein